MLQFWVVGFCTEFDHFCNVHVVTREAVLINYLKYDKTTRAKKDKNRNQTLTDNTESLIDTARIDVRRAYSIVRKK